MAQARNPLLQQLLSLAQAPAPAPAPAAAAAAISDSQLQQLLVTLIETHRGLIERQIALIEAIEAHLLAPDRPPLQGETEELLRLILQSAHKSVESLIALLQALQTAIIDSFFPVPA